MIADAAFVLALTWWLALLFLFVSVRRAARDPQLTVKIMRKIGTMSQPRKAPDA